MIEKINVFGYKYKNFGCQLIVILHKSRKNYVRGKMDVRECEYREKIESFQNVLKIYIDRETQQNSAGGIRNFNVNNRVPAEIHRPKRR